MGIFGKFKHKDDKNTDQKDQKSLHSTKTSKDAKKELTVAEIAEDKHSKSKSKSKKSKINKSDTKNAYKVLVNALITEKATYLKAENKCLFEVNPDTNKSEIKKAIYHVYGVWPTKINVSNLGGKIDLGLS